MPDEPADHQLPPKPPSKSRIVDVTEPGVGFIITGCPPKKNPPEWFTSNSLSDTNGDFPIEDVTDQELGWGYIITGAPPLKKAPKSSR